MTLLFHAVAAPLVVTVQTALLGTYGGSPVQAAFAAVSTTANTTCFLFNFLVDGVSAKVGQSVGSGNFRGLRSCVRLALLRYQHAQSIHRLKTN